MQNDVIVGPGENSRQEPSGTVRTYQLIDNAGSRVLLLTPFRIL